MNPTPLEKFFYDLDRSRFMTDYKSLAPLDRALSIGYGQTISQPSLVLDMTKQLQIDENCSILEIGTGSGYQTCLLAEFARTVDTIERIPELAEAAEERLLAMGYHNIRFHLTDGSMGWPENGPYDRIMVTAAAAKVPDELVAQLSDGGLMIIPVGDSDFQYILRITKSIEGVISTEKLEAVRFVPLVGKYSISHRY